MAWIISTLYNQHKWRFQGLLSPKFNIKAVMEKNANVIVECTGIWHEVSLWNGGSILYK